MIWWFYRALKDYKLAPSVKQAQLLRARFDRIFKRASTGYATLDRLLRRLFRNKDGLLRVLQSPVHSAHVGQEVEVHYRCIPSTVAVFGGIQ